MGRLAYWELGVDFGEGVSSYSVGDLELGVWLGREDSSSCGGGCGWEGEC